MRNLNYFRIKYLLIPKLLPNFVHACSRRPERTLSVEARKAIAGMMDLAQSITAFGNKNPMSWLRLVPHQEAPTNICWGMSNRSVA